MRIIWLTTIHQNDGALVSGILTQDLPQLTGYKTLLWLQSFIWRVTHCFVAVRHLRSKKETIREQTLRPSRHQRMQREAMTLLSGTGSAILHVSNAFHGAVLSGMTLARTAICWRWNPAQSRWERVKPGSGRDKTGKYSLEKWEEGGVSTIQTKTGGSYVVKL